MTYDPTASVMQRAASCWRLSSRSVRGGRSLRLATSPVFSSRVPLIAFPQRYHPNGQRERGRGEGRREMVQLFHHVSAAAVLLGLEHFQQASAAISPSPSGTAATRPTVTEPPPLPAMFGRLPLSNKEVESINVRKLLLWLSFTSSFFSVWWYQITRNKIAFTTQHLHMS